MCMLAFLTNHAAWGRHSEPGDTNGEGAIAPHPLSFASLN